MWKHSGQPNRQHPWLTSAEDGGIYWAIDSNQAFNYPAQILRCKDWLCRRSHLKINITCNVCPKRLTAPFFEGDIKFARDVTRDNGRTRLLLGSCN